MIPEKQLSLPTFRSLRDSNVLVYLVWGVLIVGKAFGLSSKSNVYLIATALAMVFAAIDFVAHPLPSKQLLLGIGLCGVGFVAWRLSGDASLLLATILICLFQKVDFGVLIKFTLIVYGSIAITRFILAITGFADIQPVFNYERSTMRYGLGFVGPNTAQSVLTYLTGVLAISNIANKHKRVLLIALLAFSFYVYTYTGSRTSIICAIAITACMMLPKKGLELLMRHAACLQWVIPVVSIVASVTYGQWASHINLGTFESRFLDAHELIASGGISLCGAPVSGTLDLGYVKLLGECGIIGFVMVCGLYIFTAYTLQRHKMWNELLVMSVYAVVCVLEAYCTTATLNPTIMPAALALATTWRQELLISHSPSHTPKAETS